MKTLKTTKANSFSRAQQLGHTLTAYRAEDNLPHHPPVAIHVTAYTTCHTQVYVQETDGGSAATGVAITRRCSDVKWDQDHPEEAKARCRRDQN